MTLPAAVISDSALDEQGRVRADVPCLKCGYNLRSLLAGGLCPECAHPVMRSLRGDLLRFAASQWVSRLPRGVLMILIAIGVLVAQNFLSPVVMLIGFAVPGMVSGGVPSPMFMTSLIVVQTVLNAVVVGLAMLGLFWLSTREPVAGDQPEGWSARRITRFGLWLMPVPVIVGLLILQTLNLQALMSPTPTFNFPTAFWVLCGISAVASLVAYLLVPLAALRYLGRLLRRIPRPGLARFARIEFWGLLAGCTILVLGYGWMFTMVIPVLSALPTLTTMPAATATAPAWTMTVQPPGAVRSTYTYTGAAPTTGPAILGATTTVTTTMPAGLPRMPFSGIGLFMATAISGVGGCAMFGFVIAGVVLLVLAQRALAGAAREAAQYAAASGAPSD